jgi:hypothetical protein
MTIADVYPNYEAAEAYILEADELTADDLVTLTARAGRNSGPDLLWTAYIEGKAGRDVLTATIGGVWTGAEYPDQALGRRAWLELFAEAGYTEEGRPAERPTDPLTLYRGATYERRRLMSWTDNRAVAERFAAGGLVGRQAGRLWTATVPPPALLCRINDRDESEYVVDTRGLRIVEYREVTP